MGKSQHSVAQPVPRSGSHKNQIKMLAGLCSFTATDTWRHFKAHLSHWQNSVPCTISKKVPPVSLLTASSGLSVSPKGLSLVLTVGRLHLAPAGGHQVLLTGNLSASPFCGIFPAFSATTFLTLAKKIPCFKGSCD